MAVKAANVAKYAVSDVVRGARLAVRAAIPSEYAVNTAVKGANVDKYAVSGVVRGVRLAVTAENGAVSTGSGSKTTRNRPGPNRVECGTQPC